MCYPTGHWEKNHFPRPASMRAMIQFPTSITPIRLGTDSRQRPGQELSHSSPHNLRSRSSPRQKPQPTASHQPPTEPAPNHLAPTHLAARHVPHRCESHNGRTHSGPSRPFHISHLWTSRNPNAPACFIPALSIGQPSGIAQRKSLTHLTYKFLVTH